MMTGPHVLGLRLLLGAVWSVSSGSKLGHPLRFARNVGDYKVFPRTVSFVIGVVLIPVESFVAFAHLTNVFIKTATSVALALLLCFVFAIALNLMRGRELPCHCFGDTKETISIRSLIRIVLMGIGETVVAFHYGRASEAPRELASLHTADWVSAIAWVVLSLVCAMSLLQLPALYELLLSGALKRVRSGQEVSEVVANTAAGGVK